MNCTNNPIDCPDFVQTTFLEAKKLKDLAHQNIDAFLIYEYTKIKNAISGCFLISEKYAKSLGISRERYRKAFRVLIRFGLAKKERPEHKKDGTFRGGAFAVVQHTGNRTSAEKTRHTPPIDTDSRTPVDDIIDFDLQPTETKGYSDDLKEPTYGNPSINNLRDNLRDREYIDHTKNLDFTNENSPSPVLDFKDQAAKEKCLFRIPVESPLGSIDFEVRQSFLDHLKEEYPNVIVADQIVMLINWLPTAAPIRSKSGALSAIHNFMRNAQTEYGKNPKAARKRKVDVAETAEYPQNPPIEAQHSLNSEEFTPLDMSIPSFY